MKGAYHIRGKVVLMNGTKLRRMREQEGRTLEDVATHCGVSRQAVAQWEEGATSPRDDTMDQLVGLLGMSRMIQAGALEVFR